MKPLAGKRGERKEKGREGKKRVVLYIGFNSKRVESHLTPYPL
jgi:hypothetical protein